MKKAGGQITLVIAAITAAVSWMSYLTTQQIAEGKINVEQEEKIEAIKTKIDAVNKNQCKILKAVSPKSICLE